MPVVLYLSQSPLVTSVYKPARARYPSLSVLVVALAQRTSMTH